MNNVLTGEGLFLYSIDNDSQDHILKGMGSSKRVNLSMIYMKKRNF
jgi:hypothetical protein